jgi:membrane protease YdiL (CAAX protease family)
VKPLRAWPAIGWTFAILMIGGIVDGIYVGYFISESTGRPFALPKGDLLKYGGDLVALSTIITMLTAQLLLMAVIAAYYGGWSRHWRLAVPWRTLARWLFFTLVFCALNDVLLWLVRGDVRDSGMNALYHSATQPALWWALSIVVAPVFEECLVRGMLLPAFAASRLGPRWAIVATSALWAVGHTQYDAVLMATIAVFGLLLGAARLYTGGITVPIAMHALNNLIATVEHATAASP